MGGGYQIDIGALVVFLVHQHHGCQLFAGIDGTFPTKAKLIILAVYTAEIAVGKKDSPGTPSANQLPFFTKMRPNAGYFQPVPGSTETLYF